MIPHERDGSRCHVVLVFGSRDGVPPDVVRAYVDSLPGNVVVMTGGARGVDMVATERAMERWSRGELAGVEIFPALWDAYGRGAGPERNGRMAVLADSGVGFRAAGKSTGTDDMSRRLFWKIKPVTVLRDPWDWRSL